MKKVRQKTGGRTKGTPNKLTAEVKEVVKEVVNSDLGQLSTLLEALTEKERLDVLCKLLPYVLPKQTQIDIKSQPVFMTFDARKKQ